MNFSKMNLEKIVNKAFKDARRKAPSAELAVRCMEYGFPVELQLRAIRENFMVRFVMYGLNLLHEQLPDYSCQDSNQYLDLLYEALKDNGARIIDYLQTDYPVINFGNLNYGIVRKLPKGGVLLLTSNRHNSVKVSADPSIVAKLFAMIHAYPISETLHEEIFKESCALYRIREIIESSVHKLIDDLMEDKRFRFVLTLCGTERFKLGLYEGPYIVANIYTDLGHVREDVQNIIDNHKQNPQTSII